MQEQSSNKIFKVIFITFAIIILSGVGLGFLYSALPGHTPPKDEQGCGKVGGQWTEDQTCLLSYKKTDEICTDGGQCMSGVCFPGALTEEQKIRLAEGPLNNIEGTCYPEELVTGCVEQVLMGTISKDTMCLEE